MFHWICPECGREIAPNLRQCPACEPQLSAAEPSPVELKPEEPAISVTLKEAIASLEATASLGSFAPLPPGPPPLPVAVELVAPQPATPPLAAAIQTMPPDPAMVVPPAVESAPPEPAAVQLTLALPLVDSTPIRIDPEVITAALSPEVTPEPQPSELEPKAIDLEPKVLAESQVELIEPGPPPQSAQAAPPAPILEIPQVI